jgi:hypothetical protein
VDLPDPASPVNRKIDELLKDLVLGLQCINTRPRSAHFPPPRLAL